MKTISALGLALAASFASGCNEESKTPATYTFDFFVYRHDAAMPGERGTPLSEVLVAVDVAGERQYLMTDVIGAIHATVPDDGHDITLTATKSGWLPAVTIYRATVAEIDQQIAAGQFYAVMEPPAPVPPSNNVQITLVSTGTSSFCASVAPWDACTRNGVLAPLVPVSEFPLNIVAYSTDSFGCPVELRQVMIPNTLADRTVELAFDGTGRTDALKVDFMIRFPAAPDSVMRTSGMYTGGRFPLLVWDSHATRIWGGACHERFLDANTLFMTAGWFEPPHDRTLFDLAIFPNYSGSHNGDYMEYSWTALAGPPTTSAVYDVIDIPRITSPIGHATLGATFQAQPLTGAGMYELLVIDAAQRGRLLWDIRSFHQQNVEPPALPEGYVYNAEWPADGDVVFRIQACNAVIPFINTWPAQRGMACAASAPLAGHVR